MKLSIIIPAYNAEPYILELLETLNSQMVKGVEGILIDDGSKKPIVESYPQIIGFKWLRIYRQVNQGVSVARNIGIDKAKGDYISFIDADDLVARDFVSKILEKTADAPDVIELSWKSLTTDNWNLDQRINSQNDRLPNPSVCTRVFKRSYIGDVRFNVKKDSTEDEDFCRKMGYLDSEKKFKRAVITDYMYLYRDDVPMSKTKRYAAGLMNTKRVVYYYPEVTKDMTWLLDEIKKEDEVNEVFLQTRNCEIPELKRYCQITRPMEAWGHIIRGEQCGHLIKREVPVKTQIAIYRRIINDIGGLITFMLNFMEMMSDDYDITIIHKDGIPQSRMLQFLPKVKVQCIKDKPIVCDTLIVLSFLDKFPENVTAEKVVRMCHACKTNPSWYIPKDYDELIYVSKTAMESFGVTDGNVIHNFIENKAEDALLLISATRLPAEDKGDIETRFRTLCEKLNKANIPFMWLNFSDGNLPKPPKNFYNMGVSYNMESIIRKASYVVTLSDSECWSYTVLEALTNDIPLICTPFPSVFEQGVKDGVNAHVIPFDMNFDVNILKDVPKFKYSYDNDSIKKQWLKIIGPSKDYPKYVPEDLVLIRVKEGYQDMKLNKWLNAGSEEIMTRQRALEIMNVNANYIEIIGEA